MYYHYYEYPQPHHVYPHFGIRTEKWVLARFYGPKPALFDKSWRLGDIEKFVLKDELVSMAFKLGRAFECETLQMDRRFGSADRETGEERIPGVYMELIGYSHDVAMCKEMYFRSTMELQMGLLGEKQKGVNYSRQYAREFVDVVVERIKREIIQARKERVQQGGLSHGAALAIRDQAAIVKDFFNDIHKGERFGNYNAKAGQYDAAARARGRDRANGMNLGGAGQIAGNGAKPVGSERKGLGS